MLSTILEAEETERFIGFSKYETETTLSCRLGFFF